MTALLLKLLLSFGVLDDGVLALLDQLKVERVAMPSNRLEINANGATAVNFNRHVDNDDASIALGCKSSTSRCS